MLLRRYKRIERYQDDDDLRPETDNEKFNYLKPQTLDTYPWGETTSVIYNNINYNYTYKLQESRN